MGKNLRLSPEAAQQCADAVQELIDGLETQMQKVDRLTDLRSAAGSLHSARQLMEGFERKARGSSDSLYERLGQFRDVAIRMRENFLAGGEGFAAMEEQFATTLGELGKDLEA
ncbi:hypothetical protein G4X40_20965 [Rhodococcus sp. D2-41]|uniref:hypothetical protein n=1 Tax=Speluncibacter jeojiensis TaxID=2710754 RepID=UPI00240F7A40|nr:hypothetical protein [Rhodococcus sp. D2-41]MDG3012616.1 hypothetical protein [Rhodococcus sp. D2-41]